MLLQFKQKILQIVMRINRFVTFEKKTPQCMYKKIIE